MKERARAVAYWVWTCDLVLTRDAFYAGLDSGHIPDYRTLASAGVRVVEMECAALFLVGQLRQVATGAVLAVDGNVFEHDEQMDIFDPTNQQWPRPLITPRVWRWIL